jgi:hypothetical protein
MTSISERENRQIETANTSGNTPVATADRDSTDGLSQ